MNMTAISQSNVTEVLLSNDDRLPRLQNTLQPDQQNTCPSLPAADGRQTHWLRTIVSAWPYELLSLLLSILAFISIIIFLRVYEGKTLSQWGLPISLNAIISILAAVFKGTLALPIAEGMDVQPATVATRQDVLEKEQMALALALTLNVGISQLKWIWFSRRSQSLADVEIYDRASRGPWGSFLLILHQFARADRSYVLDLFLLELIGLI